MGVRWAAPTAPVLGGMTDAQRINMDQPKVYWLQPIQMLEEAKEHTGSVGLQHVPSLGGCDYCLD